VATKSQLSLGRVDVLRERLAPPIALILDEVNAGPRRARPLPSLLKDRAFQKDLKQQVDAVGEQNPYVRSGAAQASAEFAIFASEALNPFAESGKCSSPNCRLEYARAFARSTCLYADRILIRDYPTALLRSAFKHDQLCDPGWIQELTLELRILQELSPLIDANVVQFVAPFWSLCSKCQADEIRTVGDLAEIVWKQVVETAQFSQRREPIDDYVSASVMSPLFMANGTMTQYPVRVPRAAFDELSGVQADAELRRRVLEDHAPWLRDRFAREVKNAWADVRASSAHEMTFGLNYRLVGMALNCFDGRSVGASKLEEWEMLRTIQLPWISNATPKQIVELRDAAAEALPAFRARIRKDLASSETDIRKIVDTLRSEALELEAKLRALNIGRARRTSRLMAGLGFSAGVYGFATGNPATAMAGLGIFAALARDAEKRLSEAEACHAELTAKPAYVLLTAQHLHSEHH
jgi:hypothetical protein